MKDLGTVLLETDRLILRKIKKEDAYQAFENWTNDELVTRYVTWNPHKNVENTLKLFEIWENNYEMEHTYKWIVELKDTGEVIGTIDVVRKNIEQKTAEIGYCYGSKYWNKGYGTEALKKVLDFLFNEVGFEVIYACHVIDNVGSGRVMEKAGLIYEATLKYRWVDKITGKRTHLKVYSKLKDGII